MKNLMTPKNSRRIIVGLAGRKRVGKDTIANVLKNEYGFVSDSFAAPIRSFVYELTGIPECAESDDIKEETVPWLGKSRRELMQTLGTEWGRKTIHPDIWINALRRRVIDNYGTPLVITDIRFENEAQTVRALGGWVLHVQRPGLTHADLHESETDLRIYKMDGLIRNDGDIDALKAAVRNAAIPSIEQLFGAQK